MNAQIFELIIGAVLPPIIDSVNRYVKDSRLRYLISLLISLVIATILHFSELSAENVLGSGAVIFAAAQTVYNTYYAGSDVRAKLYGTRVAKR